jgi:hypothetical protein
LPLVAGTERLAVAVQRDDPGSTLSFVRRLLAFRPRLSGAQQSVDAAAGLYCFMREGEERHLVALNFTSQRTPIGLHGEATIELSTDAARPLEAIELGELVLGPDEGLVMNLPHGSPEE